MKTFGKIKIIHKTFAGNQDDPFDNGKTVRFYRLKGSKKKPTTEFIGYIDLSVEGRDKKRYTTHSWLDHNYHGKGIGAWMYSRAIAIGLKSGKVQSSTSPSNSARGVWRGKTLNRKYKIRKNKRYFLVEGRK